MDFIVENVFPARRSTDPACSGGKHQIVRSWQDRRSMLLIGILALSCFPWCDGKGVRAPSPTDEYLASFFDPSSDTTTEEGETTRECVCDEATTKPTMMSAGALETEGRDGIMSKPMDYLGKGLADNRNTARLDGMQDKVVRLESRLADLERSSNKLKKLALAAMSVALAEEGETCEEAEALGIRHLMNGLPALTLDPSPSPSEPCERLGTTSSPASSCNHLKLACNKPSGTYFINNGYFTQVYCEMELFGGGWARYGQEGKQNEWNFIDEDLIETRLQIMDPRDIKEMIDLKYNTFHIDTDVRFSLQADDSTNPSRIHTRILPWFRRAAFYIDGFGENFTRLEFLRGGNKITCRNTPGTSHKCGWGEVPRPDEASDQVLIEKVFFAPRSTALGAMTYMDSWQSNRYTWSGSYYYVYAK